VVEPPAGFVPALREESGRSSRALFIIAAPARDDEAPRLLEEGADLVLAAPLSTEDIVWRVEAFLGRQQPDGSFELEDVFARERIDELRGLFAESLLELDPMLARDDLAPEALEGIAHRIKGSASNLRMGELAASADDALAAARAVVASHGGRDRAVAALRRRIKSILRDRQSPLAPASPQARSATEREEAYVDDRTRG
jgi:HPt (histidine-containing phosphotransfer) domain-containing protein